MLKIPFIITKALQEYLIEDCVMPHMSRGDIFEEWLTSIPEFLIATGSPNIPVPMFPLSKWINVCPLLHGNDFFNGQKSAKRK